MNFSFLFKIMIYLSFSSFQTQIVYIHEIQTQNSKDVFSSL
jgi:hypothetical protein